jgi:hypothetical protein
VGVEGGRAVLSKARVGYSGGRHDVRGVCAGEW